LRRARPVVQVPRARSDPRFSATVGVYGFVGAEYAYSHRVMAFSSIFVLPILVLLPLLQRRIDAGLSAGALR
jgi:multiple sugar transport system permease protein